MDAFDLLGLPRRPWLEATEVRAAFQRRARELHPDSATGDATAFTALNAAYRDLERPALRLRILLGPREIPSVPPDIALGFAIGGGLREADDLLERWHRASSPLSRALMTEEVGATRRRLQALVDQLEARKREAEARLQALDAAWPDVAEGDLATLAGAFSFFDRWSAQMGDRLARLSA